VLPVEISQPPIIMRAAKKAEGEENMSVKFALDRNKTLEYDHDESILPSEIWYIGEDYYEMKYKSRQDAKEFRRRGFGILLKDVFTYPKPNVQEHINAFVLFEESQSRRGLERNLARHHGEERSEMKDRARQSVLIHQRRLRRDGVKPDEVVEKLSSMYKEVCRSASVFARRLGIADELVARVGQDSSHAERILEEHDISVQGGPGGRARAERRLSNVSIVSTNSYDSTRAYGNRTRKPVPPKRCPSSPMTPSEEFYAAIA